MSWWNPFHKIKLKSVCPLRTISAAIGPEKTDPVYISEIREAKNRVIMARNQINLLLNEALNDRVLGINRGYINYHNNGLY